MRFRTTRTPTINAGSSVGPLSKDPTMPLPFKRRPSSLSVPRRHRLATSGLLVGGLSLGLMVLAGPAHAAESTANDDGTATIVSGPIYVVAGYQPTYKVRMSVYGSHRIVDTVTSKDCDHSLGTIKANQTKEFDCTMDAAVSYPDNDYFDVRIKGTGKTWPYIGSGNNSQFDLSRKLTVLNPDLQVTVEAPDGTTFDGEDMSGYGYVGLTGKVKVKNTGDVALKSVTMTSNSPWVCGAVSSTLAVGATSTITCTASVHGATTSSAQLSANAAGTPDVAAEVGQLYPTYHLESGSGSITFRDDVELALVRTTVTIRP